MPMHKLPASMPLSLPLDFIYQASVHSYKLLLSQSPKIKLFFKKHLPGVHQPKFLLLPWAMSPSRLNTPLLVSEVRTKA